MNNNKVIRYSSFFFGAVSLTALTSYNLTRKEITTSEGTNTIKYVYNNGQLVIQIDSNNKYIRFIYGLNGRPISFIYNGVRYFYIWNQLEIIGICNQSGAVVVSYSYDSYGIFYL